MNTTQFDQTIAKLNAETMRLIDETAKINSRNPYVPMAVGCAVTLTVVGLLGLMN